MKITPAHLVPGGIQPTDFWHRGTNDNTCSRCRKEVPEEDVPIMLWANDGEDMLIYCEACCGIEKGPAPDDNYPGAW